MHPQARSYLAWLEQAKAQPFSEMTVEAARCETERRSQVLAGPVLPEVSAVDLAALSPVGLIPVRLYTSSSRTSTTPLLVFYHGGGWVLGSVRSHDHLCRLLASQGLVVASVDYRLAPEHPFPAGLDDARTALEHLIGRAEELAIDPALVAVGGDSAGANLAAAVALQTAKVGGPRLAGQLLLYPVTDKDFSRPSWLEFGEEFGLTEGTMRWYWSHYLGNHDKLPNYAGLLHTPMFGLVAPAVVVTAELDPLRDEGEAYADRLRRSGVPVRSRRAAGMIHGFAWMSSMIPSGQDELRGAVGDLRALMDYQGT